MLYGFFIILACQLAGDIAAHALNLPVPGPVIGMMLLLAVMASSHHTPFKRGDKTQSIEKAGDSLLAYLGLFFVPAAVGVAQHMDLVRDNWIALAITLVVSTIATLIVTVWVFVLTRRLVESRRNG